MSTSDSRPQRVTLVYLDGDKRWDLYAALSTFCGVAEVEELLPYEFTDLPRSVVNELNTACAFDRANHQDSRVIDGHFAPSTMGFDQALLRLRNGIPRGTIDDPTGCVVAGYLETGWCAVFCAKDPKQIATFFLVLDKATGTVMQRSYSSRSAVWKAVRNTPPPTPTVI